MARFYQRKFCADGSLNPAWKPDTRKRKRKRSGKGKSISKWQRGQFVAWDSEGADILNVHQSICLLNSAGGELVNVMGIDTASALDFMCDELTREKRALHVGFVFSYDVNMILRDLPRERLAELWKLGRTRWTARNGKRYTIRYRPRKEFAVWCYERDGTKRGGIIWDVFGFFQSSFVDALKSYGANPKLIERIKSMKDKRSTFQVEQLPKIIEYCREECTLLVWLMERVHEYLQEAELKITRWDGAGAVAGALLAREGVKKYMGELPEAVSLAARHAYFGGRIELLHYGNAPSLSVWECDIRSAYPAAAVHCPCLKCGEWTHTVGALPEKMNFGMVRVRWSVPPHAPFCPFPWRSESDGNVYFPPCGEGWYWLPEIEIALEYWAPHIQILETWEYRTRCRHKPFAFIPALYELRAQWKREGRGAEKILKLGINSVYGKTAQRVGKGGVPPYHQIAWAGFITSYTRAALHRAAWQVSQHGRVLMFATDAIYCDVKPDLPESEKLGDWEIVRHHSCTLVQSGVYWVGQHGKTQKSRIRGFDDGSLSRDGVIAAWRKGMTVYPARLTRFVGMGRALTGGQQFKLWRTWHTEARNLKLTPQGKREYVHIGAFRRPLFKRPKPHKNLIPTQATDPDFERVRQGLMSAPTDPPLSTGNASGVQEDIKSEYECLEM